MGKAAELIKANKYFMSSKSWCPDCKYAKAIFQKYGVLDKVKIVELDKIDPKEAESLEKEITAIVGESGSQLFFSTARNLVLKKL
ncbi:hypothetical protein BRETT_002171 [Brettanomyces bruxellensis]|uniref:Glutaredoxin domain-containing protein n=1 Tax=Dekkera bruxellensis TaxID=5007 RepID=A0A871R5C9_DEKBR|nr:uncharacterized protein BRETT_002171 [Brettanomyces bruxellensis]QOU22007.1 hypothetical protein BRETT_002171 [Brettanomyces bruxellensis]